MNFSNTILKLTALIFLIIGMASPFAAHAKDDLYITDDYLKGLDDEVSSPEYLEKAKQELRETELHEQSQSSADIEVQKALVSMYNFEALIRTKYPSSHAVYSKLPTSSRVLIFDTFKSTKKLSTAKRMIIKKYLAQ